LICVLGAAAAPPISAAITASSGRGRSVMTKEDSEASSARAANPVTGCYRPALRFIRQNFGKRC